MFFKLAKGAGIIDFMKPVGEKQLLVLKYVLFYHYMDDVSR